MPPKKRRLSRKLDSMQGDPQPAVEERKEARVKRRGEDKFSEEDIAKLRATRRVGCPGTP